jgi:hypothetical protein
MRARRSPSPPNTADADAFSADLTVSDLPDMIDPDAEVAPRASSRSASLTVCLSCGSAPGTHGECDHPEVAELPHAPAALRAAALRLAQAVHEKRSLERALRKLVAAEVASGSATVDITPEPAPVVVQLPPASVVCPRCAEASAPPRSALPAPRQGRRKPVEGQGFFGFAAPPPEPDPAPEPAPEPTHVHSGSSENENAARDHDASEGASAPTPAKRGRPRKKPAPTTPALENT